jgi:pyrimidine-nucleoside phosphorylase
MGIPVEALLAEMSSGKPQSPEAVVAFVEGVVDGSISRPQAAAWLAWAFARTLDASETTALTAAMTRSGDVLSWADVGPTVDKHSTGGVGDKISLILAPLWAELGRNVPMISGRGLGHTGGTLDKLEAIPGFRTDLDEAALRRQLRDVGCFITGQTGQLAPADRILYALRNEISAIASVPLIVGSILSKKLAAGVDHLVLDVKVGSGAFMKTFADASVLAESLVRVARSNGARCEAWITAMDRPLGVACGNANEVREALDVLRGGGPEDVVALTLALADDPRAAEVLSSGAAYERFARMVSAQGGDIEATLQGSGTEERVWTAPTEGFVTRLDAFEIGRAVFALGAGRRRAEDPVDFGVGVEVVCRLGERVRAGQPCFRLAHRGGHGLEDAIAHLTAALRIEDAPPMVAPWVQGRISHNAAAIVVNAPS